MRRREDKQMKMGEIAMEKIEFNARSRDDTPQLLQGLKYIYTNKDVRESVFQILEKITPAGTNTNTGRPGMNLWEIFVLGTLRLNLNYDYDRLLDQANHHDLIRQMMGHSDTIMGKSMYHLQTLKDNVGLLTVEILAEINDIVVHAGHKLLKKKDKKLRGRSDSFVVETDVHYPTDLNLLFDATRKTIETCEKICRRRKMADLRQWRFNIRRVKRAYRAAQQMRRSKAKDESKREAREKKCIQTYRAYVNLASEMAKKARESLVAAAEVKALRKKEQNEVEGYLKEVARHVDLVTRRLIKGEKIAHEEKIFSIFEPHTEWNVKGKAGVPMELGLKVNIIEDQYQMILHHQVMQHETDEQVAVPFIKETQKRFPELVACSMDRGYYSAKNKEALAKILETVTIPKKGKRNKRENAEENQPEFKQAKRQHSAVESGIRALEVHGLDKCYDHGLKKFKQYVALAVVSRNIQLIGAHLQEKSLGSLRKLHKKSA